MVHHCKIYPLEQANLQTEKSIQDISTEVEEMQSKFRSMKNHLKDLTGNNCI